MILKKLAFFLIYGFAIYDIETHHVLKSPLHWVTKLMVILTRSLIITMAHKRQIIIIKHCEMGKKKNK